MQVLDCRPQVHLAFQHKQVANQLKVLYILGVTSRNFGLVVGVQGGCDVVAWYVGVDAAN